MVCSCLHFRIVLYSDLLFNGTVQLGSLYHDPWIKRLLHYRLGKWGTRDAANNWSFSLYLFVKATVLFPLESLPSYWLFVLRTIANVDLEPSNLGLRVACFTVSASRAILKLRNFYGLQCALFLLISCIPCLQFRTLLYSDFVFKRFAQRGARTHDPGIKSPMLYRLS